MPYLRPRRLYRMPQTMYNRPYPAWLPLVVCIPLTVLVIIMAVVEGIRSPAPWVVLLVNFLAVATFAVLTPECTIKNRRIMPNGAVILVRRPLVGFKRCERKIGVTGGYEVRVDGYRYEEAYIRL